MVYVFTFSLILKSGCSMSHSKYYNKITHTGLQYEEPKFTVTKFRKSITTAIPNLLCSISLFSFNIGIFSLHPYVSHKANKLIQPSYAKDSNPIFYDKLSYYKLPLKSSSSEPVLWCGVLRYTIIPYGVCSCYGNSTSDTATC